MTINNLYLCVPPGVYHTKMLTVFPAGTPTFLKRVKYILKKSSRAETRNSFSHRRPLDATCLECPRGRMALCKERKIINGPKTKFIHTFRNS